MRNIVILKDLPSNLVEEAFVVLKKNQKIPKFEYANNGDKFDKGNKANNNSDYIVKEAELLISNYVDTFNDYDNSLDSKSSKLIKKCKRMKIITGILFVALIVSLLI